MPLRSPLRSFPLPPSRRPPDHFCETHVMPAHVRMYYTGKEGRKEGRIVSLSAEASVLGGGGGGRERERGRPAAVGNWNDRSALALRLLRSPSLNYKKPKIQQLSPTIAALDVGCHQNGGKVDLERYTFIISHDSTLRQCIRRSDRDRRGREGRPFS